MELSIGKALNAGLRAAMDDDAKVVLMGEDIGRLGGVFRVTDGLQKDFGDQRVMDTPLAESAIVGAAVGMAYRGFRPVVEIQFDGFVYPAYDQIVNQVARLRFRSEGAVKVPLVIRIPYGGGIGAVEHHSESPEAQFVMTPGLTVVTPSNAHDAFWMMRQAIASDDPVIFLEPKQRYWDTGEVGDEAGIGLHQSRVAREGSDVTVVGYGPVVKTCLAAADEAEASLEVIDLRSLSPLDLGPVMDSVKRTGRVVVVHEAARTLGLGAELATRITQECFYSLEAPVQRVTGYDMPYPPCRVEHDHLPSVERILDAVDVTGEF
ncbi:alpha-ketoacid dehydrogenase subunit beta [Aeromicrobium tamlense]|uniref:Alpha-ketoacid dehydrogenase subunit beta n=1 Tax=Aeromicrobium tamlense TaxID=375541 RepID=A0A8I0KMQ9_9ACTN|nr:alpha-ketoacid dehydrogenase subunit beta [Aeromicrobium tamlense]MBD1269979.1 alpha-ketoacid dehydrogenase subunit beta [Aeromicrobium tamlense]NYI39364.1 pyruvate dehydrogenase E1 component beta subunit [Aeromicrobium tamlense]